MVETIKTPGQIAYDWVCDQSGDMGAARRCKEEVDDASSLAWTQTPPTEAGYHWHDQCEGVEYPRYGVICIYRGSVYAEERDDVLYVISLDGDERQVSMLGGRWAGPILLPKEPS